MAVAEPKGGQDGPGGACPGSRSVTTAPLPDGVEEHRQCRQAVGRGRSTSGGGGPTAGRLGPGKPSLAEPDCR